MFKSFLSGILELRGLQASGKTTLAKSLLKNDITLVRVNRDDLRTMLRAGHGLTLPYERLVKACEVACVKEAVQQGYNVVVDDTNLRSSAWRSLAHSWGVKHTIKELNVSVKDAIIRDSLRDKPVGAKAITATAKSAAKFKSK